MPEHSFETVKIESDELDNLKPLGQMNRKIIFRKFHLRKYNMGLKRM